jgi:hypothetical protein
VSDELYDVVRAAIVGANQPPNTPLSGAEIDYVTHAVVDAIDARFEVPR